MTLFFSYFSYWVMPKQLHGSLSFCIIYQPMETYSSPSNCLLDFVSVITCCAIPVAILETVQKMLSTVLVLANAFYIINYIKPAKYGSHRGRQTKIECKSNSVFVPHHQPCAPAPPPLTPTIFLTFTYNKWSNKRKKCTYSLSKKATQENIWLYM